MCWISAFVDPEEQQGSASLQACEIWWKAEEEFPATRLCIWSGYFPLSLSSTFFWVFFIYEISAFVAMGLSMLWILEPDFCEGNLCLKICKQLNSIINSISFAKSINHSIPKFWIEWRLTFGNFPGWTSFRKVFLLITELIWCEFEGGTLSSLMQERQWEKSSAVYIVILGSIGFRVSLVWVWRRDS